MKREITKELLSLFCEKNSDATKTLRLKGNELERRIGRRIEDVDIIKIVEFLTENIDIVNLQFPYNQIGDEGFYVMCKELFGAKNNIAHLNLTGCNISEFGLKSFYYCRRTLVLKSLRLTGNPIGSEGGCFLGELLCMIPSLEHLDIGDTKQDLKSIPFFCFALRSDLGANDTLKILDISNIVQNSLGYQVNTELLVEELSEMLKWNSTLRELHLQKSGLLGHDVKILVRGLSENSSLLMLDLGYNHIGNFGGEILGDWLKTGPVLTALNIAGNDIGELGATSLAVGLTFSNIRLLDLSKNKITDEALEHLMKTIKKKIPMLLLFIWGNQLGPKVLTVIERQMKARVYEQKNIDVTVYRVDDKLKAAWYPNNNYKHNYYCQLEHGEVQELKIKRNIIQSEDTAKMNFVFYDRFVGKYKKPECKPLEDRKIYFLGKLINK